MKGSFPDKWLYSFVIPILKPGKSRTDPASYRPIYLTSCACKLFERLVNQRLRYFLDTSSKLDNFQSGFRKGRTSADNLIRITAAIQRGFQEKQHTVVVLLELASAYDRVQWRIQGKAMGTMPPFLPNRQSAAPASTQEVFATYHKYDAN